MDKKRILVVEDELDLLKLVEGRLKLNGYDVLLAADGNDGLKKAREEKPDLIILDIMLPYLDGFQICRMLKFDQAYKHIPIIMFTARVQDADKELGKQMGADAYITKPFEAEVLLAKIKELLERSAPAALS
jgi:two-component system alkaline phosphatase synthesis response regulator PhoP